MINIETHYTIKQVAAALQKSDRTIRRWIHNGRLEAIRLPGHFGEEWRIPARTLRRVGVAIEGDPNDDLAILRTERDRFRTTLEAIYERQEQAVYVSGKGYEIYVDLELSKQIRETLGKA